MQISKEQLSADFSRFADLDTRVLVTEQGGDFLVSFGKDGDPIELRLDRTGGRIIEKRGGETIKHASFLGLLASPSFGNLRRLAAAQVALLSRESPYILNDKTHLPIVGELESVDKRNSAQTFLERIESWLLDDRQVTNGVHALVIDGPAGIGKTHLVRQISYSRARNFGPGMPPPLLHVQSRGRKLTTLNDVLAGTLNTLRIGLTFDQVPLLAKYGLIQVAIDGFDELADPYGYQNAWGLVSEFIQMIRGRGVLVLAGRDTFIDVKAVRKALPMLTEDNTSAAHLRPLSGGEASDWLSMQGWSDAQLARLREAIVFDRDSYALRPFFISVIQEIAKEGDDFDDFIEFPLEQLVHRLIEREVALMPPSMDLDNRRCFYLLLDLFKEVARTMSDAEADKIDLSSVQLLCEMIFADHVSEDVLAILRHRVGALALLEQDSANDERRFPHSEVMDYFLSLNYLELISSGQSSKSLSRNIIGTDTLETFRDVALRIDRHDYRKFQENAQRLISEGSRPAQESKNIAALLMASSERFTEASRQIIISGISLDEVCLRGEAECFRLAHVSISLLDARGCDMTAVMFESVAITTLLADEATILPSSFPAPHFLQIVRDGKARAIFDPEERNEWLLAHGHLQSRAAVITDAWKLAVKFARVINRQKWVRDVDDDLAGRLLRDEHWPTVRATLQKYDLLQVRTGVGVGGPRSNFYRMQRAEDFIGPEPTGIALRVQQELAG